MTNEVRPTSNAGNWHTRTVNLMLLLFPKDQKADVAQRLVEPLYAVRLDHVSALRLWLISQRPEDAEPFRNHR